MNSFHIENLTIPVPIIERGMGIVISLSESVPAISVAGHDYTVLMIRDISNEPENEYQ